ncbi:MAG TPA: sigma-70 family RNA polymerase sigma factor [Casimicrobiaceae bacterium]
MRGRVHAPVRNIGRFAHSAPGAIEPLAYHHKFRVSRRASRMPTARDAGLGVAEASTPGEQEDLELIHAVARRDRRAFERLYYRHSPRLGRYLMRLLRQADAVDEVMNDVMLVVWQNAARFDPAVSRLTTWLFGIAHNKALKSLAQRYARPLEVPLDPVDSEAQDADAMPEATAQTIDAGDPERTLLGRELGGALARALERLSPEHRSVIELAFAEDRSYQEIAAITGSPLNTVKTRMFHARRRLAEILRQWGLAESGS